MAGKVYTGEASMTNGTAMVELPFQFQVNSNIYPGVNKVNNDGQTNLKAYCQDVTRPTWNLCT